MGKNIKVQPLGRRVLVKPDEVEEKTSGGLVLPPSSTTDQKSETGKIVKLGDGESKGKKLTFDLNIGDRVYFKKYSPDEIEVDGEKYLIIDVDDILAIIK